jgi:hypothetical protein
VTMSSSVAIIVGCSGAACTAAARLSKLPIAFVLADPRRIDCVRDAIAEGFFSVVHVGRPRALAAAAELAHLGCTVAAARTTLSDSGVDRICDAAREMCRAGQALSGSSSGDARLIVITVNASGAELSAASAISSKLRCPCIAVDVDEQGGVAQPAELAPKRDSHPHPSPCESLLAAGVAEAILSTWL